MAVRTMQRHCLNNHLAGLVMSELGRSPRNDTVELINNHTDANRIKYSSESPLGSNRQKRQHNGGVPEVSWSSLRAA